MEDFKKLNERVEKILEQVNVTSMVNIGKNIFDTFMKRDILYSPDIQEQDNRYTENKNSHQIKENMIPRENLSDEEID